MITDINKTKQAIMNLNSGEFQSFCEQFLSLNGYIFLSSKGNVPGTDITKPGTPDHVCITDDNFYILVEDTTQKDHIEQKIQEDLKKCLTDPKHKIPLKSICKIVYCYNKELDDESIIENCKKKCAIFNISFVYYGLEFFANELFNRPVKYSRLAQTKLGLNLYCLGIYSIDDFVSQNESAITSPTLRNSFYGRELVIKECIDAVLSTTSIVIYGNPGNGKTRLALETCRKLSSYGYSTICIKGHFAITIHELLEAIESTSSKKIVLFIDDANEFTNLKALSDVKSHFNCEFVFVATVRSYAKNAVEDELAVYSKTKCIFVDSFSREGTKELLEASFGIKNSLYVEAIYRLSKGNPRLIVLASQLALEEKELDSISDASLLYDAYYKSVTDLFNWDRNTLITLGILAFENRINLKDMEYLKPLFESIGITEEQFTDNCYCLFKTEILEIYKSIVFFTDQSFISYISKRVFVDEKVIPLSVVVENLFFLHPNKTKNAINSLLSIFQNPIVYEFVSSEINAIVHSKDITSNQNYSEFLAFFCPFFPMKVLDYVEEKMDDFASYPLEDCIKVLRILESFVDTKYVADAIEILFRMLNKKEELFDSISQSLSTSFNYEHDSKLFNYITQESLLCKILSILPDATPVELNLIKTIIPEYIKTHYHYSRNGETEREIKLFQFDLECDTKLNSLRAQTWKIIFLLPDYSGTIEKILYDYSCGLISRTVDNQIGINDWNYIKRHIGSYFNENNLLHCLIVNNLVELFPPIAESAIAKKFLSSKRLILYKDLKTTLDLSRPSFYNDISFSKGFVESLSSYVFEDVFYLFETISENKRSEVVCNLSNLVPSLFSLLVERTNQNIFEIAKCCMKMGILEEYHLFAGVYQTISNHCSDKELFSFILSIDEGYRNNWLWAYYSFKTLEQITDSLIVDFYNFLGTPDEKMNMMGFRNILNLNQYISKDSSFVLKCLKIIVQNFVRAPFMYSCYLKGFFLLEPCEIVKVFGENYELMINSYCLLASYDSFIEDYDGKFLAYISSRNTQVLEHYLGFARNNKKHIRDPYGRLQSLWNMQNYIELADIVLNSVNHTDGCYGIDMVLSQFLGTLHVDNKYECMGRIKNWFFHLIDTQNHNREEKLFTVSLFSFVPESIRNDCIIHYIDVYDDFSLFEKIEIVSHCYSWSGSKIPVLNEKKKQLENLFDRIGQPRFIKHRIRINKEIEYFNKLIEEAEIDELLEDF